MNLKNKLQTKFTTTPSPCVDDVSLQILKPAAVLIPIIDQAEPKIILTKRTSHLPLHADQISFPGGVYDQSDANLIHTALRETEEEIGLTAIQIETLGCFKIFTTLTGYSIVPVLGLVTPPINYKINAAEVAQIIEAPFEYFLELSRYQTLTVNRQGQNIEVYKINYQEHLIWGATAKILRELALQWK